MCGKILMILDVDTLIVCDVVFKTDNYTNHFDRNIILYNHRYDSFKVNLYVNMSNYAFGIV